MCGRACHCIHLAHLHEWDFSIPPLPNSLWTSGSFHPRIFFPQALLNSTAHQIMYLYLPLSIKPSRSQDRFWGVQDPQKVGLLEPKSGLFEPHPLNPPTFTKTPFLAHFVAESGPFGRFGGCIIPPSYRPDDTLGCMASIRRQFLCKGFIPTCRWAKTLKNVKQFTHFADERQVPTWKLKNISLRWVVLLGDSLPLCYFVVLLVTR